MAKLKMDKESKKAQKEKLKRENELKLDETSNEEQREQGGISDETLTSYFRAMGYPLLILLLVFNFSMFGSMSFIDFWLRAYITPGITTFDFLNVLGNFAHIFAYLMVITLTLGTLRAIFYVACNLVSARKIFDKLNFTIMFSVMKFFDNNNPGRIVNRLTNDVFVIDDRLPWYSSLRVSGRLLSRWLA
jgi:ABC-type multidrug transport system fused ATPase/permease subunit